MAGVISNVVSCNEMELWIGTVPQIILMVTLFIIHELSLYSYYITEREPDSLPQTKRAYYEDRDDSLIFILLFTKKKLLLLHH